MVDAENISSKTTFAQIFVIAQKTELPNSGKGLHDTSLISSHKAKGRNKHKLYHQWVTGRVEQWFPTF